MRALGAVTFPQGIAFTLQYTKQTEIECLQFNRKIDSMIEKGKFQTLCVDLMSEKA